MTQHEKDKHAAEVILVLWAQDVITTAKAKATIAHLNYDIDFRQPDNGATMSACYIPTGEFEELTI